jgi:rhodanese-related sulfurtransferase
MQHAERAMKETDMDTSGDAISVRELAAWRQAKTAHVILDVREADELDICKLEGALHIPMAQIQGRIDDVPTDVPVVVMCHHGSRSMRVVNFLRKAGRGNVFNLDGGIDAWAREIDRSIGFY